MCALAHVFERAGLATIAISLVRGQAEDGRPPRALHVEFPLGRPLGRPGDPAFQQRVLDHAFALLPRTDTPVLVDFPDVIDDGAGEPLACHLPPRRDPSLHPAVDEALGLRAAYNRTAARTGRTGVFRTAGPDDIADVLSALVAIVAGSPWDSSPITDLGAAALDVRAYYEEAALGLVDHVPAARQAESWLYRSTATGRLLIETRDALRAADAPRRHWAPFVPNGQP